MEQDKNLKILSETRPDVAQIIKENSDVFAFSIKKEKEKDPETGQDKEVERKYVSVLGIELEMNEEGPGTQFSADEFKGFSIDEKSLELMKIMATGIKLNQPPLVEGPTDIGKSKTLEFLSYLTNHYLLYQSFSGQTDVTELIGKYVPAVEDEKIRFENLLRNRKGLKPETQKIIRKMDFDPSRMTLTLDECKQIALSEGMVSPQDLENLQWVWSDGTVPRAMKYGNGRGCWLYFDELGAAEPQILVKLNRIFGGNFARITITENSQNPDVEAIYPEWHPREGEKNQFRLTATTNPPSYAGRVPLEKDFIRRWVYQRVGQLDSETFLARLDFSGFRKKSEIKQLKKHDSVEGIDLREAPKLYHLLNILIESFRGQAQMKLNSGIEPWKPETREQKFAFSEFTDALRVQKYLQEMQGSDIIETLKDAIRFYYMGKIEGSLLFDYEVDENEKTKTAREKGSKMLTAKDVENKQSERVKQLEVLLHEILEGPTGPKIDGKSIKQNIEEEIKKLDPEIGKKILIEEITSLKRNIPDLSRIKAVNPQIAKDLENFNKLLSAINELEKIAKKEKDTKIAIHTLENAKKIINEATSFGLNIQERIEDRRNLNDKFKF